MQALLTGKRIVVTRARHQAKSLCRGIQARGGTPICFPTIAIEGVNGEVGQKPLEVFDWVVFTSANAARFFVETVDTRPTRSSRTNRIAAVGSSTARALEELGMVPDLVPDSFDSEHLLHALGEVAGQRFLLPQAEEARPVLAKGLRDRGAEVEVRVVYRTVVASPDREAWEQVSQGYHALTLMSPSAVRGFRQLTEGRGLEPADSVAVFCGGPITAGAAKDLGYRVAAVAEPRTGDGLISTLVAHFSREGHE